MKKDEDEAWEHFKRWIEHARPSLDGMVPLAIIFVPTRPGAAAGFVDVEVERGGAILWPKDFPIPERLPLLDKLAEPYRKGTVHRR